MVAVPNRLSGLLGKATDLPCRLLLVDLWHSPAQGLALAGSAYHNLARQVRPLGELGPVEEDARNVPRAAHWVAPSPRRSVTASTASGVCRRPPGRRPAATGSPTASRWSLRFARPSRFARDPKRGPNDVGFTDFARRDPDPTPKPFPLVWAG